MIRVRKFCIKCGRRYVYESSANIADDDPGCPDCEQESVEFEEEA